MKISNAKYVSEFGDVIDVILETERGTFPFTASKHDVETFGREIYAEIIESGISIAPYVKPVVQAVQIKPPTVVTL